MAPQKFEEGWRKRHPSSGWERDEQVLCAFLEALLKPENLTAEEMLEMEGSLEVDA